MTQAQLGRSCGYGGGSIDAPANGDGRSTGGRVGPDRQSPLRAHGTRAVHGARCEDPSAALPGLLGAAHHRRTLAALRFTEAVAPEEVRRPALRALTADLLYAPVTVAGVRELAARTGVL
ncbi:hypothetical protein BU198_23180 [Streptomyces sp. CBMA156]|nr:hypothetical protein [Streptomyces sp. CBMA156]